MEDISRDMTGIYYTCNYIDDKNPHFLANTRKQLVKVFKDRPLIVVSHKPVERFEGFKGDFKNIVVGDIGRSHLNIYRQILIGSKEAKTKWVAMIEDDILYSEPHFNIQYFVKPEFMEKDYFLYDMNRVSIFTWSKPPVFSYRFKRVVINQLIGKRQMVVDALEERFKKVDELIKIWPERKINKYFGDLGRYEGILGVTIRPVYEYTSWVPSVVFSHDLAYGYEFNQGRKKRLGDLRMTGLTDYGTAESVMKLWKK